MTKEIRESAAFAELREKSRRMLQRDYDHVMEMAKQNFALGMDAHRGFAARSLLHEHLFEEVANGNSETGKVEFVPYEE